MLLVVCVFAQLKQVQLSVKATVNKEVDSKRNQVSDDNHEMNCRGICFYVKKLLETESNTPALPQNNETEDRQLKLYSNANLLEKLLRHENSISGLHTRFSYRLSDGYRSKIFQPPRV